MRNQIVRRLLATSLGLALTSGTTLAQDSKEQGQKPATKTIAAKQNDSLPKDGAARRARIKKMGSATPKEAPKGNQPPKKDKPNTHAALIEKSQADHAHAQIATSSDGGSVAERRARIHSMRVPE